MSRKESNETRPSIVTRSLARLRQPIARPEVGPSPEVTLMTRDLQDFESRLLGNNAAFYFLLPEAAENITEADFEEIIRRFRKAKMLCNPISALGKGNLSIAGYIFDDAEYQELRRLQGEVGGYLGIGVPINKNQTSIVIDNNPAQVSINKKVLSTSKLDFGAPTVIAALRAAAKQKELGVPGEYWYNLNPETSEEQRKTVPKESPCDEIPEKERKKWRKKWKRVAKSGRMPRAKQTIEPHLGREVDKYQHVELKYIRKHMLRLKVDLDNSTWTTLTPNWPEIHRRITRFLTELEETVRNANSQEWNLAANTLLGYARTTESVELIIGIPLQREAGVGDMSDQEILAMSHTLVEQINEQIIQKLYQRLLASIEENEALAEDKAYLESNSLLFNNARPYEIECHTYKYTEEDTPGYLYMEDKTNTVLADGFEKEWSLEERYGQEYVVPPIKVEEEPLRRGPRTTAINN